MNEIIRSWFQVTTSSVDVAEYFGKDHDDVVKAIEAMEISQAVRADNFAATSSAIPMSDGGTRTVKSYDMTGKGFTLLVMGFTGEKAMRFKLACMEAFETMEDELLRVREQMRPFPGKSYLIDFGKNGPVLREVGRILSRRESEALCGIIRTFPHRLAELYDLPGME